MTPERIAALEAVPGWVWEVDLEAQWQARLEELRQHAAQHGRLPLERSGSLGKWVGRQRMDYKALQRGEPSHMTAERIAALEAVSGWAWDAQKARWEEMYRRVLQETVQGGRLPKRSEGQIGSWVASQHRAYRAFREGWAVRGLYKMTDARAEALEDLPGWRVL